MAMQTGAASSKILILVGAGLAGSIVLKNGRLSDVIAEIQGWSFSDVMFVTKRNMAAGVANMSKQLEQVSTTLAVMKRHLTQRLENLDGKLDEQKETSKLIMNEVHEVKTDISQIGFDIESTKKWSLAWRGKLDFLKANRI